MIIIAWLIVVLMTPVDAAAHAPSPANIAPACNLGGSSTVDATYRTLGVFPKDFGRTPMACGKARDEDGPRREKRKELITRCGTDADIGCGRLRGKTSGTCGYRPCPPCYGHLVKCSHAWITQLN